MSSLELGKLLLSPRARQDFIDILRYTGENWEERQLLVYKEKIDGALQLVRANPQIGHHRQDLPPTHRLYPVGSHLIVYRLQADDVAIVRILHQRMSLTKRV